MKLVLFRTRLLKCLTCADDFEPPQPVLLGDFDECSEREGEDRDHNLGPQIKAVKRRSCMIARESLIERLLAALAFSAAMIILAPVGVNSQEPAPAPSPATTQSPATSGGTFEKITVVGTGTLIPTAATEQAMPITTYTEDALRRFGATTPIEGLRSLPSFYGTTSTENDSNFGTGAGAVNLRALGSQYTLTLINGRRVTGFDPAANIFQPLGFGDLNLIPLNFIASIDIEKDGATTTYGSDAVAGVVNIKLKNALPKREYGELDFLFGQASRGDATTFNVTAIGGYTTDKFSLIGGYDYYSQSPIYARDRPLSANLDFRPFGGRDTRSKNQPGNVIILSADGVTANEFTTLTPSTNPTSLADYRQYDPFHAGKNDLYNFAKVAPSKPERLRNSVYAALDYKIFDNALEFFGTFLYTQDHFYNGLAASPSPGIDATTSEESPYYPGVRRAPIGVPDPTAGTVPGDIVLTRFRSILLGPRQNFFDNRDYYFVGGFRGEIPSFNDSIFTPIVWEVAYSSEEFTQNQQLMNDYRLLKFNAAVINGTLDPFVPIGGPQSGSVVVTDAITGNTKTYTYDNKAALRQASYAEDSRLNNNLEIISGTTHTTFFPNLPQGGFTVAVGSEYRWQDFTFQPGPAEISGDVAGFTAINPFKGTEQIGAIYGELLLPIVTPDMKIPFVYSLDVDGGYRYEQTVAGGIDPLIHKFKPVDFSSGDPKLMIRFQPIPDITIRGTWSTAFRAPTPAELYATPSQSFPELTNPVTGATEQPQNGVISAGNTRLNPEKARIETAGIVYTPSFVPGRLTLSVDYYEIDQTNLISSGDAQFILDQFGASGGRNFATLITFLPTGQLKTVIAPSFNVAARHVEGLDYNVIYQTQEFSWGQITWTFAANYVLRFVVDPGQGGQPINFLGRSSQTASLTPGSVPRWKGFLDTNYAYKSFATGLKGNYIGDYADDTLGVSAFGIHPTQRRVREWITFDWRASYEFKRPEDVQPNNSLTQAPYSGNGKATKEVVSSAGPVSKPSPWAYLLGGTTIQVGVNNIFDKQPPFSANALNDGYDTSLYNNEGRFYYVSISKNF
jgi:iron complex outermembrane receptor protein